MEIQQTINIIVQPNASAQNPYAWDEPEADGVFRPENHIGQPTVKKVIEYLYLVNGIAGGLLSFALLFIVLTQSNGPLQHYKRMLLLCCSSDIGFWICDNIVEVRAKLTEGVFMITFEGPAKYASYDVQLHAMCWYVCQLTFMHTILPSQYFYRYYSVSRMRPLNTKQTLGLYFISLSATIPMYYYSYQAFRYSALIKPGVNYAKYFYDEQPIPSLLVGDLDDLRMKLYFLGATLAVGGSYALILFIAVITLKNLNFNSNKFTTKTKEMQHQLSMVLFFQTILPIFTSVVPILGISIPGFLYISTGPTAGLFLAIISLVPTLNPLLTIAVIGPYRRYVMNVFYYGANRVGASGSNQSNRAGASSPLPIT